MDIKRVSAGLIDFTITAFIQSIMLYSFLLHPLQNKTPEINLSLRVILIPFAPLCYLIFRDLPGKKSIGKRMMSLKVVDTQTAKEASARQRLLRNITWILGPVELFFILTKEKRLGETLTNTSVLES